MFAAGAGATHIDVRSVWFLLLYASDLLDKLTNAEKDDLLSGERDNDLFDALAQVLAHDVETRMRSMLLRGYRARTEPLTRVRGRIDHLGTARRRLMESGRVQCSFEEQTVDLPRYRYMLVTLRLASHRAHSEDVRRRCLTTAQMLERSGVTPVDPSSSDLSKEQFGHFDATDRKLISVCKLVRDMSAPEHSDGRFALPHVVRDEGTLRRLFEKAVLGFYQFHLGARGASVRGESRPWPAKGDAAALSFLPRLNADVIIRERGRQIIVECKFAPMFTWVRDKPVLKPEYVRQVYAYSSVFAQSFEGRTEALLLGALVDGSPGSNIELTLDGMPLRVRQVDLSLPPSEVRLDLMEAVETSLFAGTLAT